MLEEFEFGWKVIVFILLSFFTYLFIHYLITPISMDNSHLIVIDWLGITTELGVREEFTLIFVAWILAVNPALVTLLKQITGYTIYKPKFTPHDPIRHIVNLLFLFLAGRYQIMRLIKEAPNLIILLSDLGLFTIILIAAYGFSELLVYGVMKNK